MTDQICRNCGHTVLLMCQKNTGFCRPSCADEWHRKESLRAQ